MRSENYQVISFLMLISVILASCGGGDSSPAPAPAASLAMKGTSGNAVNMNGTWTVCSYSAIEQTNERLVLTMNGGSATMTISIWSALSDANCTQATAPDAVISTSSIATLDTGPTSTAIWVDGGGLAAPAPVGIAASAKATKATVDYKSATVTLSSDAGVADFNNNNVCGAVWVKNVPKNVLTCTDVIPTNPETNYWVVDDSAATLKWYTGSNVTAWQVENFNPMTK